MSSLSRHLRIAPATVALGTDSKATRLGVERDFSTPLRSAQNDSRRACGLSRCPRRPGVRQRSHRKKSLRHARCGRKIRVFASSIQKHWVFRLQSGGLKNYHPLFSLYSRTFPTAQSALSYVLSVPLEIGWNHKG